MQTSQDGKKYNGRPVVYDYGSPVEFLRDLLAHYKTGGAFSLRQRTQKVGACSQSLVSQILKGQRQLNRKNLAVLASVFKLTPSEIQFIDNKLSARFSKIDINTEEINSKKNRMAKNHLLSDWLHPYVKDLIHIKGFSLHPEALFYMLKGMAPVSKIKKSVEFLLREGFWRVTPSGEVVPEEAAVVTTNDIPNEKIRAFHKKALEVALRGINEFPAERPPQFSFPSIKRMQMTLEILWILFNINCWNLLNPTLRAVRRSCRWRSI